MSLTLRPDDLSGPATQALIASHQAELRSLSPEESCHVLDLDGLRDPAIEFWSAWDGDRIAGIGALKQLDAERGELKSMRAADAYRGRGIGRLILRQLITAARVRGLTSLWLETGAGDAFVPARRLYESEGFVTCAPFGAYRLDPLSVYYTRVIGEPGS